jgi:hypothetical protein
MAPDLFDLTETAAPPVVRIDGVSYPLRRSGDLTLHICFELQQLRPRIDVLLQAAESGGDRELASLLARVCQHALLAPAPVREGLPDGHRLRIAEAFFAALADEPPPDESAPHGGEPCPWHEAVPRLQRFYGGSVASWWAEVPVGLMRRYLAMMPRLEAEESFRSANRIAVGTGALSKDASRGVTGAWRAAAGLSVARRQAAPSLLRHAGIGRRLVPRAARRPVVETSPRPEAG